MVSSLRLVVTQPILNEALMSTVSFSRAAAATMDTSPVTPFSAAVNDSTDVKSTSTALTLPSYAPGFLDLVKTVTWKFASTRALTTCGPRVPEAWYDVSLLLVHLRFQLLAPAIPTDCISDIATQGAEVLDFLW